MVVESCEILPLFYFAQTDGMVDQKVNGEKIWLINRLVQ